MLIMVFEFGKWRNKMATPRFTRRDFEFIADEVAPLLGWATGVQEIAQKLKQTNPKFDYDKFVDRATKAWEANYLNRQEAIDDDIPY